eukprot:SAG22_NODE_8185_length_676_cov_0.993068_2_plen_27_part_01
MLGKCRTRMGGLTNDVIVQLELCLHVF